MLTAPLAASASTAGALFSSNTFYIPEFQREYSWGRDEVNDLWNDLKSNILSQEYFLGLIILTDDSKRKLVVDGQQRLITLSLLAAAIHQESLRLGRPALAERVQSTFLRTIDYSSDELLPRIQLASTRDNDTFRTIVDGNRDTIVAADESVSSLLVQSFDQISLSLSKDLSTDPFKRLGEWVDFLINRLYVAVFLHQDENSAYRVFEVINTRGKDLTTADLLKNWVLSQTAPANRAARYEHWKSLTSQFTAEGAASFVQYIRHAVTVDQGHVLPRDLYDFLVGRLRLSRKSPPGPDQLMELLDRHLPLYLQMVDPDSGGPADADALRIFASLNSLGVIAVRPILLALADVPDSISGMEYVLKLVVRRIVVGNLGTGNVERKFGEAARSVQASKNWRVLVNDLGDLNPSEDEFVHQLRKRSFNKGVLSFVRRSVVANDINPPATGVLHSIWAKQAANWRGITDEEGLYWGSTIGNSLLAKVERRHPLAEDWDGFKEYMLPQSEDGEWKDELASHDQWTAKDIAEFGNKVAEAAGRLWYGGSE